MLIAVATPAGRLGTFCVSFLRIGTASQKFLIVFLGYRPNSSTLAIREMKERSIAVSSSHMLLLITYCFRIGLQIADLNAPMSHRLYISMILVEDLNSFKE